MYVFRMGCLNHSDPASLLLLNQNSVFCCICWNIFVTTVSATIPLSLYISTEGTLSFAAFFVYYFYIIIHSHLLLPLSEGQILF